MKADEKSQRGAGRQRIRVYATPHLMNRLALLRHHGQPDESGARPASAAVKDAILLAAVWCETHPGRTLESAIREWRQELVRVPRPNR